MDFPTFVSPTAISPNIHTRGYGTVSYGNGDAPHEFFMKTIEMTHESEKAGIPIFKSIPFIRYYLARGDTIEKKVNEEIKRKYPQEWKEFETTGESSISGTPIEQWAAISADMAATLRAMGLRTLQQFAACPDTSIQGLMGGFELRAKAQNSLKAAESNAPFEELSAENASLKKEMAEMKEQMNQLLKQRGGSKTVPAKETE